MYSDNELYNEFEELCLDISFERFVEIIDKLCNVENVNPINIADLKIAINSIKER